MSDVTARNVATLHDAVKKLQLRAADAESRVARLEGILAVMQGELAKANQLLAATLGRGLPGGG